MKVRYIGDTFGVCSLTNGKIYECIKVEKDMLRIIDDEEEDYLYSAKCPGSLTENLKGKWEIVEDNEKQELYKAIYG